MARLTKRREAVLRDRRKPSRIFICPVFAAEVARDNAGHSGPLGSGSQEPIASQVVQLQHQCSAKAMENVWSSHTKGSDGVVQWTKTGVAWTQHLTPPCSAIAVWFE